MNLASRLHGALDWCARRRADGIAERLLPHLPQQGPILDLGSGSGHNAEAINRQSGLRVVEADLANLARVGGGPVMCDGRRLPFRDRAFRACTLIFVLQYVSEANLLWDELRRVVAGPVLVMQSVVSDPRGRRVLRASDHLLGPAGCSAAASIGYFGPQAGNPSWVVERSLDRASFESWARRHGRNAVLLSSGPWPLGPVRHELFRLETLG